ncbi:hypothetical protein ACTFIW_000818 [Dictyostelium discoideum]
MLAPKVKEESATKVIGTEKVKSLESLVASLEGEIKTLKSEYEKIRTENVSLLIENTGLNKDIKSMSDKHQSDLDHWKSNYDKLAYEFKSIEKSQESNDQLIERNQSTGKPIAMDAFDPVIDLFFEEGPAAAIERVEWIFSLYLVNDPKSRLNYLISCVFKRPSETRNDLLKVANTLSDYLLTDKVVKWKRITEIVSSCDNASKRKADSWGFNGQITVEVLKYRDNLSEDSFKNSCQTDWFGWIRKAVNTLKDARLIQQFRDEVSIEPFNNYNNNNFYNHNSPPQQQYQQYQHHQKYYQQQQQQHQHHQHQQQQQQQQQQHQHQQQLWWTLFKR